MSPSAQQLVGHVQSTDAPWAAPGTRRVLINWGGGGASGPSEVRGEVAGPGPAEPGDEGGLRGPAGTRGEILGRAEPGREAAA